MNRAVEGKRGQVLGRTIHCAQKSDRSTPTKLGCDQTAVVVWLDLFEPIAKKNLPSS